MLRRPNIVWIVTTQWRAQACGYAGDPNARTPWLDALASESTNYPQAVTPHPMGPQARAALLTGKLCPLNGVSDYWDPLPVDQRTIAHAMRERGYTTAFFGKWHLAERDRDVALVGEAHAKMLVPEQRRGGFEFWEGFESGFLINDPWLHGTRLAEPRHFKGYQSDVVGERAARWMQESHGAPYFCVVSLEPPHPPYDAPAPHLKAYDAGAIVLRANVPRGGETEAQARRELAGYYRHLEATDRAVGRLLAEIGLGETVVVFTSVHGDMHGSHGHFRKGWPYEESVRVPLLVRHPAGAPKTDGSIVSLVDLPAMTVAWAEQKEWSSTRQTAWISIPKASALAKQCPFAWHGSRGARQKQIRVEPSAAAAAAGERPTELRFDLAADPFELCRLE
ncbi:MAG: sulfatase-like hydrolase/transferase [Opitutae bacterium]|nr:sulfatase-like hydrolase/transferase [Opitutae bacterium]